MRYIKLILTKNTIIALIISSIISNTILLYQNYRYECFYKEFEGEKLNIIGTIVDNGEEKEYKNVYKLKIHSINGNSKYKNMYLYIETKNKLEYGNKISFKGEYTEPTQQRNYGGFDYKEYLKTKKIYGTVELESNFKCIKQNNINFVFYNINKLSKQIQSNIKNILSEDTRGLFLGILIGYTDEISDETRLKFSDSNLSHVLAISGAHVSYIIICFTYVLKKLSVNKKWTKIITSFFLIFFIVLTKFSVSVIRASISGVITLLASVVYRRKDIPTTLSIPILIILIYNPFLIKSMSLILTYAGTISIILFNNNILELLNFIVSERKFKIPKFIENILLKLNQIISLTLSAQILIIPIIMYNYNTFSTVFLFTSIISSIVIGPIIMGGLILILVSFINITLAKFFSIYIEIPLKFLIYICEVFSNFKYSKIYVTTPRMIFIIVYFCIVIIINCIYNSYKTIEKNNTQKRMINILHLIRYKFRCNRNKVIGVCLSICILIIVINNIPGNLEIHFIDVGQR